jgi:hypothetical protein
MHKKSDRGGDGFGAMRSLASRATVAIAVAAGLAGTAAVASVSLGAAPRSAAVAVMVSENTVGRRIPPGFVGLSIEYPTLEIYAGQDPNNLDPVFEQLVRNLAPAQRPILRIGGDSTDLTWFPLPGVTAPRWVRFSITPTWLAVAHALAVSVHLQLVPSVNLEADSRRIAVTEARAILGAIGRQALLAFEVGNEPSLYSKFTWYRTRSGAPVTGRPRSYNFAAYQRDFSSIAAGLPGLPLAGPSLGPALKWVRPLDSFLRNEPRVKLVTMHRYGLNHCGGHELPPPSVASLTSAPVQRNLVLSVQAAIVTAHAHHVPLRVEELNAVSCGGLHGVSDVFASALWALDTLFEVARVGADGVNVHTHGYGLQSLFSVKLDGGHWSARIKPEYYGLLMFARAAPPNSQLLQIAGGGASPRLHVWATRGTDGRVRIVLINDYSRNNETVVLRVAGVAGSATVARLIAPSLHALGGVSLGGQSFGASTSTGILPPANTTAITSDAGSYRVTVPSGSAALVTLSKP